MSAKVFLVGNCTKQPDSKRDKNDKVYATFGVANNISKDKADFYTIVAYGKLGELASQYVNKGDKVAISGRLEIREYDGKVYGMVTADGLDLMSKKETKEDKTDDINSELPFW